MSAAGYLLALDTATTRCVVALGRFDGALEAETSWPAGYRHGETLLPSIEALLVECHIGRADLGALIIGTGPGAFTGLRVGIATAKGIAHGLGLPIAGIPTSDALIAAAAAAEQVPDSRIVLLLPAGPNDRVVARRGTPARLLPAGEEPVVGPSDILVAVDLEGRAAPDTVGRGERARADLAREMLRLGAARLSAGEPDDLAELVPEYVTLPRGVAVAVGEVGWSRGPR